MSLVIEVVVSFVVVVGTTDMDENVVYNGGRRCRVFRCSTIDRAMAWMDVRVSGRSCSRMGGSSVSVAVSVAVAVGGTVGDAAVGGDNVSTGDVDASMFSTLGRSLPS